MKKFATDNDLPMEVPPIADIHPALNKAWVGLRSVHGRLQEGITKGIHEKADSVAEKIKTDRPVALKNITAENSTKSYVSKDKAYLPVGATIRIHYNNQSSNPSMLFSPTHNTLFLISKGKILMGCP